jgi:hypothetical protein
MSATTTDGAQWRADLLKRVERWTYRRKIRLCAGLRAKVVSVPDVIVAHGLAPDEIARWMEAYRNNEFEALRATYQKSRAA